MGLEKEQEGDFTREELEVRLNRKLLLNQRRLEKLSEELQESSFGGDIGDRAQFYQTQINLLIEQGRCSANSLAILTKFKLCNEGKWDVCGNDECGGHIDHQRLKAVPETIYCLECGAEKQKSQPRSRRRR